MIRKRSISLQGHPTSVSLEDAYWRELKRMAADSGLSLAALLEGIDRRRESLNLSSALRLAVLDDLKAQLANGHIGNQAPPPG
jgi:predicted DNA-binding ribbon-helix-helix protein